MFGGWRRTVALATLAAAFAAVPPLGMQPAAAAVGATPVVRCKEADCWPAAFAFTPSGRELFYLERFTGEIRRVDLRSGRDRRWGSVDGVAGEGEQGALGIDLDPAWSKGRKHRWIYVFYTDEATQENLIVRLRKPRTGLRREILYRIAPTANTTNHNGGVIHFGPDGRLYAVTGERDEEGRAQDVGDPAGKVLRLNRNGSRPADNPFTGLLTYSFGHRNSFGFAFDPRTDRMWQTENGPECDDEINPIEPGENYGWGADSSCPDTNDSGPMPRHAPAYTYNPVVVPTGAAFCDGCGLGSDVESDLLVGTFLGGSTIRDLSLNATRDGVISESVLYDHPSGVLAVEARPGRAIFFSDRGSIYRLTGP